MKLKHTWKESYDKQTACKNEKHYFANKVLYIQSYGFSSGHVWMSMDVIAGP